MSNVTAADFPKKNWQFFGQNIIPIRKFNKILRKEMYILIKSSEFFKNIILYNYRE